MANVVITSTENYIKVDYGVYFPSENLVCKAYYNANDIEKVELFADMVIVHLIAYDGGDWKLSYDGSVGFQVDTVDGAAPASNGDLCDKIAALIKA